MKEYIEILKYHLGFELNYEPSKINDNMKKIFYEEMISSKNCGVEIYYKINGKKIFDKKITEYINKVLNIKYFIDYNVLKEEKKINDYMKKAIEDYEKAVNSLDEILKYN